MSRDYHELSPTEQRARLKEIARVFLKLGTVAFGGPAAHVAMMDDEVVKHRQWLDRQTFLDLVGATSLIPGPSSTELAIYIGYKRGGWPGLIVAGACFVLPAMLMVWVLAAAYARYQSVPQAAWLLYGIKPVIVAIVAQALWGLGRVAVKNVPAAMVGLVAMGLSFMGWSPVLLLVAAGLAMMLATHCRWVAGSSAAASIFLPAPGFMALGAAVPAEAAAKATWPSVFWAFVKIGSVVYGSGYVLLAFLQKDLVERWHWLTSQQLLDAVAIGQFTPGPVFTTATFIGYLVAGNPGAMAATIGIFVPAFVLVAFIHPWVSKLRRSSWAGTFLDGVTVASLALMTAVTWSLARAALVDWLTVALALLSLAAVLRFKINSAWLVIAGGCIGLIARAVA